MKYSEKAMKILSTIVFFFSIGTPFSLVSGANAQQLRNSEASEKGKKKWHVDVVGFNYTDRVIDSFSVNGESAGNVLLSSQTSGGGKTVCCVTVSAAMSSLPRIRVRWQVDGCTYLTRSKISGEVFENIFPYYKQADVVVNFPAKIKPQHMEVHFYPDGTVSVQMTESISLPRISLDGRRADISNYPRCRNDKKPE